MTLRHRKRLLDAVNVLLLAALGVMVAWAALSPVPRDLPEAGAAPNDDPAGTARDDRLPPLAKYAAVYARDLRKPLYDPEPVEKVEESEPTPPLRIELTGTVVEPGYTYAFFRTRSEPAAMANVGDTVDGAEVVEIASDSVTVRWHGDLKTLRAKEEN